MDDQDFRNKVYEVLANNVEFGERISYKDLAVRASFQAGHARAVGSAMRNNPVSLFVPCHRVVKSSGSVGNYSGGMKNGIKEWLLEHESI